jgi:predicted dehydrogenase
MGFWSAMSRLRIGVVGVGHLGFHHARNYARMDDVDLVGVADLEPARLEEAAGKLGAQTFESAADLLPHVDAVSVAVTTTAHYEVASLFLQKGIHCLVEKPITPTVEEGQALVDMANSSGAVLQVGHIERYNPVVGAVAPQIAEPRYIECHRLAPFIPRGTDVNVVLDLMVHDIDLALSFAKSPVGDIQASGSPIMTKTVDIANAWLEFENGCVANLTANRVSTHKVRKVRVFQRKCYFSINCLTRTAKTIVRSDDPEGLDILKAFGAEDSASPGGNDPEGLIVQAGISGEDEEPLYIELRDFVSSIQEGRRPQVTGEDGVTVLRVALEALSAIRNG